MLISRPYLAKPELTAKTMAVNNAHWAKSHAITSASKITSSNCSSITDHITSYIKNEAKSINIQRFITSIIIQFKIAYKGTSFFTISKKYRRNNLLYR